MITVAGSEVRSKVRDTKELEAQHQRTVDSDKKYLEKEQTEERGFFHLRREYLDRNQFNDVRARVCASRCLASSVYL